MLCAEPGRLARAHALGLLAIRGLLPLVGTLHPQTEKSGAPEQVAEYKKEE
jgi:hypothetical protein